jgi:hypothetical protein
MLDFAFLAFQSGNSDCAGISCVFILLVLLIWSLVWVFNDAEARGKSGCLVALLVFFLSWPISLLVWLVFRPERR